MSLVPLAHFLKTGGKCPWCHWHTFWKREENVQGAIGTIFENRRKMSGVLWYTFSKREENVPGVLVHFLKTGGKCPGCYWHNF